MLSELKGAIDILRDGYKLEKKPMNGLMLDYNSEIDSDNYFITALNFFVQRMKEVKPNFYYPYLEDNIKSLKVKQHFFSSKSISKKSLSTYDFENNGINCRFGQVIESLYHELMHLSSSICGNDFYYCGFLQKDNEKAIGVMFNEGYTQLLVERYFYDQDIYFSYSFEKMVALYLEKIVGKELMENDYFNADLVSLETRVTDYCSDKEFVQFLFDVDALSRIDVGSNANYFREKVQDIWSFLFNIYTVKQKYLLNSGEISYSEFLDGIRKNVMSFSKQKLFKGGLRFDFCSNAKVEVLFSRHNIDFSLSNGNGVSK